MIYSVYTECKRPVHKAEFGQDLKFRLIWCKGEQLSRKRFHFTDGEKYYAFPHSWSMLGYFFGYNISLTLR